jgi:hypothetical protein
MSILIGGFWGKQFGFTPLPGALEVVSRIFSLDRNNTFTPFE